jgi:tRNA pseudouridine synthase 10
MMSDRNWRQSRFEEAVSSPELRDRAARAQALGPLCDHCLGRLFAGVGTGLRNEDRGRTIRRLAGLPVAPGTCSLCHNLFGALDAWTARIQTAVAGLEFATFLVSSHPDPALVAREEALWSQAVCPAFGSEAQARRELVEGYKQEFNRAVGVRLADALGKTPDLARPDLVVLVDHAKDAVTVLPQPLFVAGRYRKLVRGMPQCRWRGWPTSVQQVIGDPICRAAAGADHDFHGAGREDVDVRCLGERPFVVEIHRPRRRTFDWAALSAEIGASGTVEVAGLEPCGREEPARLKALRPDKTYRALVRLRGPVAEEALGKLGELSGEIRQQTPKRMLKARADCMRLRHVRSVEWERTGPETLELRVRTSGGLYVKELISGDGGRTRPSIAGLLGTEAECAELDVAAIHLE